MIGVLVVARLFLAAVFVVAGVGKLIDRPGTRQALTDFDVPRRLSGPLALFLPAAELAAAIALVFPTTARWGAVGSLALLMFFVVGLARVLRRGETPDCHCFGQLHSKPASQTTVARNLLLALPAGYVTFAGPGPSLTSWIASTDATDLWLIATSTLAAVVATMALLLWREKRRPRSADGRADAAPRQIGALAPQFSLPSATGQVVSLQDLLAGDRACLLIFVSTKCGSCVELLPELARWHHTITERLALTVVASVEPIEAEELAREHALTAVLVDQQSTVMYAYGVNATPSAILLASDGTVRSAPAAGRTAIESLIRLTLHDEAVGRHAPVGATT